MPQKRQRNEELRDSPETKRLPRREGLCVIPSTEGVCRDPMENRKHDYMLESLRNLLNVLGPHSQILT